MFARLIFASYYKLLTGAALALAVFALTGCNEKAAETVTPGRPGATISAAFSLHPVSANTANASAAPVRSL